ncbi:MAG: ATP-binding protein [Desulfobacterium sp.]|nr:ATP-binding protein [Desulfobacterium sp.]
MSEIFLNLRPSPSALIQSLRDIGYSMESAIADVIDNSITAGAEKINVNFAWNDGSPWLAIIDDGNGMTPAELTDAMRLGSKNPLEERKNNDLGRFGLGLKTASFSQCRQLTLISNKDGMSTSKEWDLDLIEEDPDSGWKLRVLDNSEMQQDKHIAGLLPLIQHRGTIVLWRKLDRYDGLEKKLNSLLGHAREHLELIFHRFLSPSRGKKRLNISLNNDPLIAFNPFNPLHNATQELPEQAILVEGETVKVQPFVLPHYNKTSHDEYEKYSGEGGYLQNQGFYVYRNRRLIIKGTWFRLIKKEELTKLLRVQVDIPNSLDHFWKIDVKKSNATPPETIRNELKQIIDKIATSGKRVYRQRGQKLSDTVKAPGWTRTAAEGKIFYQINRGHPLIVQIEETLQPDERQKLKDLIFMLESSFPTELFYSDVAKEPEALSKPIFNEKQFSSILDKFINHMIRSEIPKIEISERLKSIDPFASYPQEVEKLLRQKGL